MRAAFAEQLGVSADFAAEHRAQARAEVGKDVARAHDKPEHFAIDGDDFVAGHVVHGGDKNFVEFFVHRGTIPLVPSERQSMDAEFGTGTGFAARSCPRSFRSASVARFGQDDKNWLRRLGTGTGFADAKLSEILPL